MSAVPESYLPVADANRIRREIKGLSQEQSRALETAMYMGMSSTEQDKYDHRQRQIAELLKQITAVGAGNLSKVSARMVELSLQQTQREETLPRTVSDNPGSVSSPLPWTRTDIRTAQSSAQGDEEPRTGTRNAVVPAAAPRHPHLSHFAPSESRIPIFRVLYSWAGGALEEWSRRTAGMAQLLAPRLSANLNITAYSQPWRRLKHASRKFSMLMARAPVFLENKFAFARPYRCRDCHREVGFRSRPRTFMECYILPLLLVQPVRCAACFRRDYWLIFTTVRKRPHHDDETTHHIHRNAA
jgi:hypothetical protein